MLQSFKHAECQPITIPNLGPTVSIDDGHVERVVAMEIVLFKFAFIISIKDFFFVFSHISFIWTIKVNEN